MVAYWDTNGNGRPGGRYRNPATGRYCRRPRDPSGGHDALLIAGGVAAAVAVGAGLLCWMKGTSTEASQGHRADVANGTSTRDSQCQRPTKDSSCQRDDMARVVAELVLPEDAKKGQDGDGSECSTRCPTPDHSPKRWQVKLKKRHDAS